MPFSIKKVLPHILVLIGFVLVSLAYFSPVLKGKQIYQSDIKLYIGMAKQQSDYRTDTNEETYWTNSAYGGMPTYQLGAKYPHNYIKKLDLTLRFLPRPADYLFLYFLGFYILLLVLKVDFKLAILGAFAFGFSTYLIIILGVGHNSKAHAIAYMPLVLSGIILTFQRKYITGFLLTAIAMALEICANHFQMTYYLMLLVIVLGIAYMIDAYKKQLLPHYFKSVGLLFLAVILAIGLNATNILATQEYVKESTRGKTELTINPDGSTKKVTSGMNKEEITEYSYGFLETFNLFISRIVGGGNNEDVGKDSASYEFFINQGVPALQAKEYVRQTPAYWGKQPIVEAPAYIGAVVIFLFVFALFLVKGRLKWWIVGAVIMSWILSLGKNWFWGPEGGLDNNPITNFMIDYFPLYSKFRAVTSIQVILELCIPILAIFGLSRLFNSFEKDEEKLKALKYTVGITAGIAIFFLIFKTSLGFMGVDFAGVNDGYFKQSYGQQFMDALRDDRKMLFTQDAIRTLVLVLLSAGIIFMFLKKKLSETLVVVAFGVLILFDLISVDKRYVNNDDFVSALQIKKPYQANTADVEILKDTTHFRVFDIVDNSTRASYFHNALSGYHAAKLKRYDELFDFHIARNNMNVLNMLNTKYIIAEEEGKVFPFTNTDANGNAWFVTDIERVENATEEIIKLDSLNTKISAIFSENLTDKDYVNEVAKLKSNYKVDSIASITLDEFKPNYLKYTSTNSNDGFAVFSEVYYGHGWQAYIDGRAQPHFRVNYVLRGLPTPPGKHIIEFKFEPKVIKTGSTIALATSVMMVLLIIGGIFYTFKKKE